MRLRGHRSGRAGWLLLIGALSLTACGSSPGQAVAGGPATTAAATSAGGDTGASAGTSADLPGDTTTAETGAGGADGTALDMKVRVVNVYLPQGATQGIAVDVWAGVPGSDETKKLVTVPYGQVSDFFAPVVFTQGTAASHESYSLTLFPAGKSAPADAVGSQQESAAPGQELTLVLGPGDATGVGGATQVFVDELGSAPDGSGFSTRSAPSAPSGKAVVALNGLGVPAPASGGPVGFTMAGSDGACLPYLESDTGQLHDPAASTAELVGGTSTLPFVVPPGQSVRVVSVGAQQSAADACKATPLATLDASPAAGKGAYAWIYGPSIKAAKVLLVPID